MKCDLCSERRSNGKLPACVEICPNEALLFGKRSDVLKAAKNKIKRKPDTYIEHIYGEHEVGGTTWMYIAGKKFDKLKMPPLGTATAPGISEAIQHGIFAYFVPPVTLFALLGTMMWVTKWKKTNGSDEPKEKLPDDNDEKEK